ncbi:sugar kinase [Pseudonocardia xishanensis]|uniref:PfkB family carbohydrate kinase n=1 Tax=Pseudonocardia xishanensis TaxID=630995 RepID=A0ABP8S3I3_9PSEU
MRVVCLGAHILDVLGRPVTDIPAGQGRRVLEEIRVTAAGTAGGTAVDLAKLGADVVSVGPVGADAAGRMLRLLLADHGVDTSGLVAKPAATPATMLPIRPDGSRPALHAPGAMATLTGADVDPRLLAEADVVHVGGPDVLGDFALDALPELLRHARAHGTVVSMDLLSVARPELLDRLAVLWPLVDHLLPNDDQLRGLTGRADLAEAAAVLRGRGVGTVVVTRGGDGALVVSDAGAAQVPALAVPVVDTTGCGDAFTAGYLVGLDRGWSVVDAARLGTAAASLVAQGLGSDAGIVDLPSTLGLVGSA